MYFGIARIILLPLLINNLKECVGEATWTSFATSKSYRGYKIFQGPEAVSFQPVYIPKDIPYISAIISCSQLCARDQTCQGTNFHEGNNSYVCELLDDNFCRNQTSKAPVGLNGSLVWEKLSAGEQVSCFDIKIPSPTNLTCGLLRPGSVGSWPNCFNSTKTGIDWNQRGLPTGNLFCTLWPDGNSLFSLPIVTYCSGTSTFLILRKIDLTLKIFTVDFRMSFADINRLYKLGAYNTLRFLFKHSSGSDSFSDYANSYIDASGTLSNMTYQGSATAVTGMEPPGDIFRLNGTSMKAKPFITVRDDIYGCGSFWLLDTNNATYCPGGKIKMLGTVHSRNGSANLSTLFRYPRAPASETFITAFILLVKL